MTQTMGLHETLELHELLTFKNVCLTKSTAMSGLVQDDELRNILAQDVTATKAQIGRLQQFMTKRGEVQ